MYIVFQTTNKRQKTLANCCACHETHTPKQTRKRKTQWRIQNNRTKRHASNSPQHDPTMEKDTPEPVHSIRRSWTKTRYQEIPCIEKHNIRSPANIQEFTPTSPNSAPARKSIPPTPPHIHQILPLQTSLNIASGAKNYSQVLYSKLLDSELLATQLVCFLGEQDSVYPKIWGLNCWISFDNS